MYCSVFSVLDTFGLRRHGEHHDGEAAQSSERLRVVVEESKHGTSE